MAFGDAGLLQQRQRTATGADEDEPGGDLRPAAVLDVLHRYPPATAVGTGQVDHPLVIVHGKARLLAELAHQQVGEGTVIDVGPGDHAGRGHRFVGAAPFHDQRCPLGDLRAVFAVFHALIAVVGAHGAVALTQEGDVVRTPDETQVRAGVDEGLRIGDGALADQVGPQLARDIELGVHLERLGDVDAAVVPLRGVVQLAIGGMPVPALFQPWELSWAQSCRLSNRVTLRVGSSS